VLHLGHALLSMRRLFLVLTTVYLAVRDRLALHFTQYILVGTVVDLGILFVYVLGDDKKNIRPLMEEFEFILGGGGDSINVHTKHTIELPRRWRWVFSDILCIDANVKETMLGGMVADETTNAILPDTGSGRPRHNLFRMTWFPQPVPVPHDGLVHVWASGDNVVFRGGCDALPHPFSVIHAVHVRHDIHDGTRIIKLKSPSDVRIRGMMVRGALSSSIDNIDVTNATLATLLRCPTVLADWVHIVPMANLNGESVLHTGWRDGGFVCSFSVPANSNGIDIVYVIEHLIG
jgi:hypothetical protein